MNPLDDIPNEILYEICKHSDIWSLLNLTYSYDRSYYVCQNVIKDKIINHLWEGYIVTANLLFDDVDVTVVLTPYISGSYRVDELVISQILYKENITQEDIENVLWVLDKEPKISKDNFNRTVRIEMDTKEIENLIQYLMDEGYYFEVSETGFILP